jgi:hypothetical protein
MDQYLTHYWPMCNGQMLDKIGTSHMTQGNLTNFDLDRFGKENSSLNLNGGWTQVPNGVYFDTNEFVITVWVKPRNVSAFARIIDFGNEQVDNVIFGFDSLNTFMPYVSLLSDDYSSSSVLSFDQWQFLAVSYNGTSLRIYKNDQIIMDMDGLSYQLPVILRNNCYIGKSNWHGDGYSYSLLDDLRFYNKSLTQTEIIDLMNQNDTGTFFKTYISALFLSVAA